ncbi:MAG TPA: phage major capsid protein [Aggregatilineales bacterium]|nr:phage major capsid protein [Chloroflexota bacterium]HOA23223.1 phage major capsid protein [Aggregatilineales bacterium]HPV06556.1 phage major capsid protein [Aggregatilineales bacterium]HQA67134.1 phage major capsid protein [Aggregatilineales bacterium]HQE18158.1 phage major capsid protein [Aggregatilineales bacterium]
MAGSVRVDAEAGEDWVLDVLGVPYGGPFGGKDAEGEYFTPESDLWLERIPRRPVVYYHGLEEEDSPPQIIGEELGWERREDGVWFRVLLDRGSALARRIWEAAQKGFARASSGAIGHLVRTAPDGRILVWPIGELSLLDAREHLPANPYAVAIPYTIPAAYAKALFDAAGLGVEFEGETPTQPTGGRLSLPLARGRWASRRDARKGLDGGQPASETHSDHPTTSPQQKETNALDEQTIRNIIRQELGSALADLADDPGPRPMFMTRGGSRGVPAVIGQRGEPLLTANGTPFVDAIKALRQGRFDVVRFQLAGKALAEGDDAAGGYLVPTEHSSRLVQMLSARTAVRAAGATVVPMTSDSLQIPAQTGGATAYWVAENTQINASQQTWGQIDLRAKKLAALTKLSAELFEDSDPQVEALVMSDLARALALEEDVKYLRGDGANNTPTGLEHITGVNVDTTTLGADGGTPTFDHLADMLYRLDADNVPVEGRAWVAHPRTLNTLRQVKDQDGAYLWADPAMPGDPPTLWGYPVYTTTAIPINETQGGSTDCSTLYLGCWPEFVVGQRKALELRASDEAGNAFEYDQVFIRAIMRVDANVRHAGAFEVLKGVRP